MPFTLSHPAVVVPLRRIGLPLSALVVGSMAPDFPYLLALSTRAQNAHTWLGVFWFCVPVGLAVLAVFHGLLKRRALWLLPEAHRVRLARASQGSPLSSAKGLALTVVGLIIGAFSHLVWDSFTHEHGWSVEHLPLLRMPLVITSHGTLHMFKVLQHGSSLAGAIVLVWLYVRWYRSAELRSAPGAPVPAKAPNSSPI